MRFGGSGFPVAFLPRTSRLCLLWVERYPPEGRFAGKSVENRAESCPDNLIFILLLSICNCEGLEALSGMIG